ncbi:tetratricopeptide repeat protein [Kordia algicida OT-1]|uniref:Uncharacterized protein n=1 Tax=Kordia algicida OT-1 TaxID=391587 RepID=A9E192_9FLAO|nr:tetratricopeptide repeat protein [Kordia algicida]EDP95598.1 hypothetical protein KAOT1_22141 [Kordia algicida OT-1]
MNKEEIIQDYIANRLSEKEKLKVEALLKTDEELQEIYETHVTLAEAFKLTKSAEIKERLQELDANEVNATKKKWNFGMWSRIAVAAVFILGIFYTITQLQSNDDFYELYFEKCPNTYLPVTRGNTTQDLQIQAFIAYESNDFTKAVKLFEKLLQTSAKDNLDIQFYYAMSLLNQEKYELALNELNTLTNTTFDYQAESLWYAALLQLKSENTAIAKKYLLQLRELNPSFKSEKVGMILEEL